MNKKRLLCLLTSVCLSAAMCARPAMAYTDVEQDDAFYEAVQQAGQYAVMNGTGEELFEPDEAVSLAAKVLSEHLNLLLIFPRMRRPQRL